MKFTESYEYDAPLAKVWKMLSDPAFVIARDEALEIPNPNVETAADDTKVVSITSGDVPASMIPPAAQRFLKGGTSFLIREEWQRVNDTTVRGQMHAEGKGIPAGMHAEVTLKQEGSKTKAVMNGELTVNIPFLGAKLERQAISFTPQLIAADQKAATAWLANN